MDDIHASDAIAAEIRSSVSGRTPVVFVAGNFNVVHPGHVRLLRFAREAGAFLVVGIYPDSGIGATVPAEFRLEAVRAIKFVDSAFVIPGGLTEAILAIRPDFVVKGKEHETRDNPERAALETYGGRLLFSSGDMRFSSFDILDRDYRESRTSSIRLPLDYPDRHKFTLTDLRDLTGSFSKLKVIVVGDLIIDDYIECDALGMSQEDPAIVVTPIDTRRFVGGAGIVAAHASGLGANVRFFSVSGQDDVADYAEARLREFGVEGHLFRDPSRPSTLKQRYRASGKTLLRVSHLRQHAIPQDIAGRICAEIEAALPDADLVLFSDFNYGCLPTNLVHRLVEACGRRGVPMAADSQASSQLADISRFKGMKLITPTELEARLALKDRNSGLVVVGEELQKLSMAENIIITLGSEGLLVHAPKQDEMVTDQLLAMNPTPQDVAGAGDSLFTCTSLALAAGADIWQASYLGSIAAACQVGRVGNTPLSRDEITAEIELFT